MYYGKIYSLPNLFIFYKPFLPILMNKLRRKIFADFKIKEANNERLRKYVQQHTQREMVIEVLSFSSFYSASSDTSSESFQTISSQDSSWVDMKKLL